MTHICEQFLTGGFIQFMTYIKLYKLEFQFLRQRQSETIDSTQCSTLTLLCETLPKRPRRNRGNL